MPGAICCIDIGQQWLVTRETRDEVAGWMVTQKKGTWGSAWATMRVKVPVHLLGMQLMQEFGELSVVFFVVKGSAVDNQIKSCVVVLSRLHQTELNKLQYLLID